MTVTPMLADAGSFLVMSLIAFGILVVFAIITTAARSAKAKGILGQAQDCEQRGDWKGAASHYGSFLEMQLASEEDVKQTVPKLQEAYRQLGVQADLSRIHEFHKISADAWKAKMSVSEQRKIHDQAVAELHKFLAQYS